MTPLELVSAVRCLGAELFIRDGELRIVRPRNAPQNSTPFWPSSARTGRPSRPPLNPSASTATSPSQRTMFSVTHASSPGR